jgi:hypothetical protein
MMPLFLKKRRNSHDFLPTTGGGGSSSSLLSRWLPKPSTASTASGYNDGSARSIRLQSPMVQHWQRARRGTKITYILLVSFLLSAYGGYRSLRYYNASVHMTCHAQECTLTITPLGRSKSLELQFARSQLVNAEPVKTLDDGTYLNIKPDLREEVKVYKGKQKYQYNYKGPDKDGNYLSYALILRNANKTDSQQGQSSGETEGHFVERDISAVGKYAMQLDDGTYRLILRQFRISQSRRRIKTMIQKVESFVKYRREKLIVKENAPPSVRGIIMIVVGAVGFILTLLIGEIWHEETGAYRDGHKKSSGPGARRPVHANNPFLARSGNSNGSKPSLQSMGSQYEVSTVSHAKTSSTTRKRH